MATHSCPEQLRKRGKIVSRVTTTGAALQLKALGSGIRSTTVVDLYRKAVTLFPGFPGNREAGY